MSGRSDSRAGDRRVDAEAAGAAVRRRHRRLAVVLSGGVAGMLALAFASAPLYRLFCQATGFDGTPLRAASAPAQSIDRTITVRFDAGRGPGMQWTFEPVERKATVRLGEQSLAFYRVHNPTGRTLTGTATFSVAPGMAASYFNKIECFCFTEQTLKPGETVEMPVSYFIDPALAKDADIAHLQEITLSYTFYPVDKPAAGEAGAGLAGRPTGAPGKGS